jgi:hypothetical protein
MKKLVLSLVLIVSLAGVARAQDSEAVAEGEDSQSDGGTTYQAPGIRAWVGRRPTRVELRQSAADMRSRPNTTPQYSEPDYKTDQMKVYIGRRLNEIQIRRK